jgi:hypothetical protein
MREVPYTELVPGVTYYIQSRLPLEGKSGKIVGTFQKLSIEPWVTFATFTNLHPLPKAKLPTGMGSSTTNKYSVLAHKFYLPENEENINSSLTRAIIKSFLPDPNFDNKVGYKGVYEGGRK